MKGKNYLLLLVLCVTLIPSSGFAMDKETLWSIITSADTAESTQNAQRLAIENPDILEEILFIPDSERDNSTGRGCSLVFLEICSLTGKISEKRFFDDLLRLFNQITTVANPIRLEDERKAIVTQLANYGDNFPAGESFSKFSSLTEALSVAGQIRNQGIQNSLNQKISNAQKSFEKKGADAKIGGINQIQAAINELAAQKGKGISEDAYQILSGYCKNLITKIQATP